MIKFLSSPRMTEYIRSESGNGKRWDMMIEKMDKVVVLLSTYNGEKFLEEQLRSLQGQIGVDVTVLVRDDGSTDNTHAILDEWSKNGFLSWYTGPNLGPAKSFLDLLCNAPDADYYAFCDQDDVWHKDKVKTFLCEINATKKDLYFSDGILVDAEGVPMGNTLWEAYNIKYDNIIRAPIIKTLVRQSLATGAATIVSKNLIKQINAIPANWLHDE